MKAPRHRIIQLNLYCLQLSSSDEQVCQKYVKRGPDHNIFYGLHSAISRRGKDLLPVEGWNADEALTSEEALRGYTVWPAYASFSESKYGQLKPGYWADITVLSIDPLNVGHTAPEKLFEGEIVLTMVNGKVVYKRD